jgi:hypothetical protein
MSNPPFFSFRTVLENRVAGYLEPLFPGVAVHKGVTDEIRVIPIIIAHAESSSNIEDLGSKTLGNYKATLKLYIYSSADDETLESHRARVVEVIGAMRDVPALQALWNPSTDGQLYDLWIENDEEGMSQRRYGNVLEYNVWGVMPPSP